MLNLYKLGRGKRAEEPKSDENKPAAPQVSPGALRIQTDMSELELPANCKLHLPDKENLMNFEVSITPDDGFWKDGTFVFSFAIPENYPHKPPKTLCMTKVSSCLYPLRQT
jgi:ubiquitin-conjugating enzyme E2 M